MSSVEAAEPQPEPDTTKPPVEAEAAEPEPTNASPQVRLILVSEANVRTICELQPHPHQQHLVAPAAYTVAEGHYAPGAMLRAIYHDQQPVGVLLLEMQDGVPCLVRLLIGAEYQGQGVGRQAVALVAEPLRRSGWAELQVSYLPGPDGSEGFWRSCGFQPLTGGAEGEQRAALNLQQGPTS